MGDSPRHPEQQEPVTKPTHHAGQFLGHQGEGETAGNRKHVRGGQELRVGDRPTTKARGKLR